MNRLQSTLSSTYAAPKLVNYHKSKPRSQLNKSYQDVRGPRELVTWGITPNDGHYQSSYSHHYNSNMSPNIMKQVYIEPASPPPNNLSASVIPFDTPKFTTGRRNDTSRNATSDLSSSESPRSGRKQFSEIKHKDDYTKDDSPDSYLLFHNDHVPRKHSPNNPAHILKKIHVFHSQVHENFMSAPPDSSHYDDHAKLHSTITQQNTAGASDLKKRMFPKRQGRKLMSSPREESDLQDILRHSYASVDGTRHTKSDFKHMAQATFQTLRLRQPEYHEKYTKSFYLGRSITPTRARQESVHSRKSASQERSFGPNQSFKNERLNESAEHRFFADKSFSDLPMNSESQFFNRVDPNNSSSLLLLNKSYADTSIYRTLPETMPETESKTEKSLRSIPLSSQSRLRSPVKNYEAYKKIRDQPSEKIPAAKEVKRSVKTMTFGSQPTKKVTASSAFLSGRITLKQGAFSGVHKKYTA